jgi:MbtH protein
VTAPRVDRVLDQSELLGEDHRISDLPTTLAGRDVLRQNVPEDVATACTVLRRPGHSVLLRTGRSSLHLAEGGMVYAVVVNHEEQYSVWPTDRDLPSGWSEVGVTGAMDECLAYIERVWTDMTPLSLRSTAPESG